MGAASGRFAVPGSPTERVRQSRERREASGIPTLALWRARDAVGRYVAHEPWPQQAPGVRSACVPLGEVGQAGDIIVYVFLTVGLPVLLVVLLGAARFAKWIRGRPAPARSGSRPSRI